MLIYREDFTGTDGASPSSVRCVVSTSPGGDGAVADIHSNELRLLTGTTNPGVARVIFRDDNSTNFALADVDVYVLWDVPNPIVADQFIAVILRTTNNWNTGGNILMPVSGYAFEFDPNSSTNSVIYKHVSGTSTILNTASHTFTAGTKVWLRAQAIGTALRFKLWDNGLSEPSAWDIDTTDSSLASGGIQARNYAGGARFAAIDTITIDDLTSLRRMRNRPQLNAVLNTRRVA